MVGLIGWLTAYSFPVDALQPVAPRDKGIPFPILLGHAA
jgi:hypothetical protein